MRNKLSVLVLVTSLMSLIFPSLVKKHHEKELPSKDEIIGLASIVVPSTNPLEQYLLDHENDLHMCERK